MRSVEAMGRHKHAKDGLIARTPGVEPEEAAKRVEEYAASRCAEMLDEIKTEVDSLDSRLDEGDVTSYEITNAIDTIARKKDRMEHLTTNLEQSKLLKEWGAPQNTVYFYGDGTLYMGGKKPPESYVFGKKEYCSAYTLQELINWLGDDFIDITHNRVDPYYFCYYAREEKMVQGSTPLEAVFLLAQAIKGKDT